MRIKPCMDCNGVEEHEPTCPLAAAIEAICFSDESWFKRFPWLRILERDTTTEERAEMARRGFPASSRLRITLYNNNFWVHEAIP